MAQYSFHRHGIPNKAVEWPRQTQPDPVATSNQFGNEPDKLQRVPVALLGFNEDGLPDGAVAVPKRQRLKRPVPREFRSCPAGIQMMEATRNVPTEETVHGPLPLQSTLMGMMSVQRIQEGLRGVEIVLMVEPSSKMGGNLRIVG